MCPSVCAYIHVSVYEWADTSVHIPLLGQVTHRYMYIHSRYLCIHIHESRFAQAYTYMYKYIYLFDEV